MQCLQVVSCALLQLFSFEQIQGSAVAKFSVELDSEEEVPEPVELEKIAARTVPIDLENFFSGAEASFSFGSAFSRLEEVRFSADEVLGQIRNWSEDESDG